MAVEVVAIGGSLGGVEALAVVLAGLPDFFPAPVVVAQHRAAAGPGNLAGVLARRTRLQVAEAEDGQPIEPGRVYLAPRDRHLRIAGRHLSLDQGEAVHRMRPAIDPLFESVAESAPDRCIAVVLSGLHDDGARGARCVKASGGRILVQAPSRARARGMPMATIATGCVDFVLPTEEIAPALVTLAMAPGAADLFRVAVPPWATLD